MGLSWIGLVSFKKTFIWTHRSCNNMHQTFATQNKTKLPHGKKRWEWNFMPIYTAVIGNYWLLWEGEKVFSQIVTPGKEIMLYWKATHTNIWELPNSIVGTFKNWNNKRNTVLEELRNRYLLTGIPVPKGPTSI